MELLGIKFAPINTPIRRRLETLSAAIAFASMSHLIWIGICACIYLLFTRYWIISISYLYWIFIVDSNAPEQGGRSWEWIRSLSLFRYAKNYYPVNIHLVPGMDLDKKKNYIMAAFPHGVLATGAYLAYTVHVPGSFQKLFPWVKLYSVTLKQSFFVPIFRDFLLAMGFINATANAINYVFSKSEGGSVVGIIVGGAAEAFTAEPGQYHIVLKNRKGFIKIALKNGTPIIPVFSFGEVDLFKQLHTREGTVLRSCQEWIKKWMGFAPIIFFGRGFFQYSFGMIPFRKPINIVIGKPIEVKRDANPTEQTVNALHKEFMDALTSIFEEYKAKFVENPKESILYIS